jgi:hypothetical protein
MKKLSLILETNWSSNKDTNKQVGFLHDKLKNHYGNIISSENDKQLSNYTATSYTINNHLWKQHQDDGNGYEFDNIGYRDRIDSIDNSLNRSKTPQKLSVYSGTAHDPRNYMNDKNIVHHPAYISTSLSNQTAQKFTMAHYGDIKHVLKINVPKGHPGAYVDHMSENPGEHEFVLPRGLNLKYKGTTKHYPENTGLENEVHEHNMDIV